MISSIFTKLKDEQLNSGVICSIQCQCGNEYIGQTKINLQSRIIKHDQHFQKRALQNICALVQYSLQNKRRLNFEKADIIENKKNLQKPLILESLHIKANLNNNNFRIDTKNVNIADN